MDFVTGALTSIKAATDIAKFVKESHTSLEEAEVKLKIAELISALADVKTDLVSTQELIREKDNEIRLLEERLKIKGKVVYEKPYYWLPAGNGRDGPFCQCCYDKDNNLMRLQDDSACIGYWECKVCKSTFHDSRYNCQMQEFADGGIDSLSHFQ